MLRVSMWGTIGPVAREEVAVQPDGGPVPFAAELWSSETDAAWCFVTVPVDLSDTIEFIVAGREPRRGFGSVRVEVTTGATTWRTSLFPDKGRGAYVLPVKRAVRDAEGLHVGEVVEVAVRLVD